MQLSKAGHAIRAAENAHIWGSRAASVYARNNGVPCHILLLALRLEREERAKAEENKLMPIFLIPQAD